MPLNQIMHQLSHVRSTQGEILKVTHETAGEVRALNRRVDRIEDREYSKAPQRQAWEPRDYMTAGAGLAMVLAAITEKAGWTTVIAAFSKMYGGR